MVVVKGARPSVQRRRRTWPAVAIAGAALAAAAGWYCFWRPGELSHYQPLHAGVVTRMDAGYSDYETQLIGPQDTPFHDTTATLRAVVPDVVTNSAGARIRVLVCPHPELSAGSAPSISSFCLHPTVWAPGTIDLDQRENELILEVTPRHAGMVDIAGLDVSYTDGLRRGRQHTGNEIHARVFG